MNKVINILCNDVELHTKLEATNFFKSVTITSDITSIGPFDILMVSDRLLPINSFLESLELLLKDAKGVKVFYMLSGENKGRVNTIKPILQSKGVCLIPPSLTVNQIVERVCFEVGLVTKKKKNIVAFLGADNNVGTTITAQSIAETLSGRSNSTVCLLFLNGQPGLDYYPADKGLIGLDNIKAKIQNKMLTKEELISVCVNNDKLYMLRGANSISELRYYYPGHIEFLISLASDTFDVVLIDAGCRLGMGISIGALNSTNNRYLITTQGLKVYNNFLRTRDQILSELDIDVSEFYMIVNKYMSNASWGTPSQLAEMYKTTLVSILPDIPREYALLAERDRTTLMAYGFDDYNRQIEEVSKVIANQLNINFTADVNNKKGVFKWLFSH
jgi:hypothetical protein